MRYSTSELPCINKNKYEEAVKQFDSNSSMNDDPDKKSSAFYNLGNSLLMNGKITESINAYKNSLRLKPGNLEAKYNLAYAQDLLSNSRNGPE
jgi:tetratricopeptide (TPR) repeat protein